LTDPLTGTPITEVRWAESDALPFPLCISAVADAAHGRLLVGGVSVARGNLVLADHGYSVPDAENLGRVPPPRFAYPSDPDRDPCAPAEPVAVPSRFNPALDRGPLCFAGTVTRVELRNGRRIVEQVPFDPRAPAAEAFGWPVEDSLPVIEVDQLAGGPPQPWAVRRDLLGSDGDASHFVVEVEHDGSARLRFGDGVHGRRPPVGASFSARYRVGNGRAGNIGAETIAHLVGNDERIVRARNPLPARGGTDPEDAASVRRRAPQAFRRQQRAVTAADYAARAGEQAGVQRAAATLRWTGSWHTVFVTIDRLGGGRVDDRFGDRILGELERYRMAGQDLAVDEPIHVSIALDLLVCVAPGYLRAEVRAGLLAILGNRRLPDGRLGLFHPDRQSFGQALYLSAVYAAARGVAGVAAVQATRFERQGNADGGFLAEGVMRLARLEVPRLDNDPNFPEHGVLGLDLIGGQ
jgi:hypothetical protein